MSKKKQGGIVNYPKLSNLGSDEKWKREMETKKQKYLILLILQLIIRTFSKHNIRNNKLK